MPECHKCPFAHKVERGDYAKVKWQKTPCFTCYLNPDQQNNHGRTHISMQAGAPETDQTLAGVDAALVSAAHVETDPDEQLRLSAMVADVRIARGLLSLSPRLREIALMCFDSIVGGNALSSTVTQCEIAHRIGCTPQNLSAALREIIRRWPDFASLLDYQSRVSLELSLSKSRGRHDQNRA